MNRSVVSSLSASSDRDFNTSVGGKVSVAKNTIAAVVANDQSVINGQAVKFRLTEPMWVGNALIPRNTPLVGVARLQDRKSVV